MTLTKFEQSALSRFLKSEGFTICDNLSQIKITDRYLTGKGFITELMPNHLHVLNGPSSFRGGHVGATINGNLEVGFLFFIKKGYVDAIECYTYGEEWPSEIKTFDFYLIDYSTGQKEN
jgi:hypothetical protein